MEFFLKLCLLCDDLPHCFLVTKAGVAVMLTLMQGRHTAPSSSSPFQLSVLPPPPPPPPPLHLLKEVTQALRAQWRQTERDAEQSWDGDTNIGPLEGRLKRPERNKDAAGKL